MIDASFAGAVSCGFPVVGDEVIIVVQPVVGTCPVTNPEP